MVRTAKSAPYLGNVGLELPPLAAVDEEEFFNGERQPLPPPDAALWVRRIGALQPLA